MQRQCAWCGKMLSGPEEGSIRPLDGEKTHGICPLCSLVEVLKLEQQKPGFLSVHYPDVAMFVANYTTAMTAA